MGVRRRKPQAKKAEPPQCNCPLEKLVNLGVVIGGQDKGKILYWCKEHKQFRRE